MCLLLLGLLSMAVAMKADSTMESKSGKRNFLSQTKTKSRLEAKVKAIADGTTSTSYNDVEVKNSIMGAQGSTYLLDAPNTCATTTLQLASQSDGSGRQTWSLELIDGKVDEYYIYVSDGRECTSIVLTAPTTGGTPYLADYGIGN